MPAKEFALVIGRGSAGNRHVTTISECVPGLNIQQIGAREADRHCLEALKREPPRFGVIASPATQHVEMALRLISMGVPLLIEKPFADTASAARQVTEAAKSHNGIARVGYVMRYLPEIAILREVLRSGAIGSPLFAQFTVGQYLPDWRPDKDYRDSVSASHALGGGVLLELSHEIDTVVGLFGTPDRVACSAEKLGGLDVDVEDFAAVSLWFRSSAERPPRAEIRMDYFRRDPSRHVEIFGTDGTVHWNVLAHTVCVFRAGSGSWETQEVPGTQGETPFHLQLQSFLEISETSGVAERIDFRALRVMEILESCRTSIAAGGATVTHWEEL